MGVFDAVIEEDKADNIDLGARYDHLKQYAQLLEVADHDDLDKMIERAELHEGVTKEKLDTLQMLIEAASDQKDMREGAKELFSINSMETLDWYFQKQVVLLAEIKAVEKQYEDALRPIRASLNSLDFMYKEQAMAYAKERYKLTGKKTEVFPHGTIKVTSYKSTWVIEDEKKLQEWLGNLEQLSKAKFEVYPDTYKRNLDALKEAAEKGSKIPGLVKKPAGDSFALKVPV